MTLMWVSDMRIKPKYQTRELDERIGKENHTKESDERIRWGNQKRESHKRIWWENHTNDSHKKESYKRIGWDNQKRESELDNWIEQENRTRESNKIIRREKQTRKIKQNNQTMEWDEKVITIFFSQVYHFSYIMIFSSDLRMLGFWIPTWIWPLCGCVWDQVQTLNHIWTTLMGSIDDTIIQNFHYQNLCLWIGWL